MPDGLHGLKRVKNYIIDTDIDIIDTKQTTSLDMSELIPERVIDI